MTVTPQFILDYRSPYSYLANSQLRRWNLRIDYRPVDILNIMQRVNNQPSPLCPPKARYAKIDAARWARSYDVPFAPNQRALQAMREGIFDGALLSRVAIAAQDTGAFEQINDALFEAVWAGTDDLGSFEGRSAFLAKLGLGSDDLWQLATSGKVTARLSSHDDDAVERGVFGVPTVFVGKEMFFGNDRLHFAKAQLEIAQDSEAHT